MSFAVGLYGYTFTRPFATAGLDFVPLDEDAGVVRTKARDRSSYNLTGLIIVPAGAAKELRVWRDILFDVEASLTFIEQQRVALSNSVEILSGESPVELLRDPTSDFSLGIPHTLALGSELSARDMRPTSGSILQFDAFNSDMRVRLLDLLIPKLRDQAFLQASGFRSAFFRNVEMSRSGDAPIDVNYSLLFTGLELLAHKRMGAVSGGLSELLFQFLTTIGLPITRDEGKKIAACRNALFHRGEYETECQLSGSSNMVPVKLNELSRLDALFADALLKVVGFDDPHINWNRWRDRMAYR